MAYTNSPQVSYTKLSPNNSGLRTHSIDRITPHCVVGQCSVETIGAIFASKNRNASCNYGIGSDGRVALIVEEKNRSWCSSSASNDQRAVTIECASDTKEPYAFNAAVYDRLISLCIDICKRNGKRKLLWLGDKEKTLNYTPAADEMVLTVHRWFANKSCIPVDSEVLTKNGWVKLKDIQIGDEIACADLENLRITFEEVYDKMPERDQDTYTNNGFTATKDHRCVYKCHYQKDFRIENYKHLLSAGQEIYIPLAGYADNDGLRITDDELRFLVAVQADGHYIHEIRSGKDTYIGLEFHLKKERKIERIVELIDSCHFEYTRCNKADGSVSIRIWGRDIVNECEKFLTRKRFNWEWINMSKHQADIFLYELLLWDGCTAANLYTSKDQMNLDVVSAVAALNGVGSNVTGSNIQFRQEPFMTLGKEVDSTKRNTKSHGTVKTKVSCVSVKTGIFLVRQNGKTFITGNCPGDWMYSRMGDLAQKVTAQLSGGTQSASVATDQSTSQTTSNSTADNEKTIWNYLKSKGLNDYAAAGLMGNLYAESSLNPANLQNNGNKKLGMTDAEFTAAYDEGSYSRDSFIHDGYGYGLAQWTYYTRKQALADFAKRKLVSIGDLSMQLEFLWQELQGYKTVLKVLNSATSVRQASDAVLTGYEKPADQSESVKKKRASYGEGYYRKYASSSLPYKVRVDITDLNIRTGPGTNYKKTGSYTGKGTFTIVEEKNGWGKLKSGAGWISLAYAKKV